MITFVTLAILMVAATLSLLLPTLLRKERAGINHAQRDDANLEVLRDQLRELHGDRVAGTIDQAGYDSSRNELERRVTEDVIPGVQTIAVAGGKPVLAASLAVLIPVIAVALYMLLGHPAGLDSRQVTPDDQTQNVTPEQINGMVEKLVNHMKEKPNDIDGWGMLARSYNTLGRFGDAADVYVHLEKLVPPNADLLADHADSLGMAHNKSLLGEPEKMIEHALLLDPNHVKALALSGGVAFEHKNYALAILQWKKILTLVPADSDMARTVASSIDEAQGLVGQSKIVPVSALTESPKESVNDTSKTSMGAQVSGTVDLNPALRSQVSDTDMVYVFARAVDGPRFPLAVLRKQVKDLPLKFILDDSTSMMPNAKLSDFPSIMVGARISKSGSATPNPGDFEGMTGPLKPGAKDLAIRINTQRK
jgi:cytochrome c-type biogenesis protein CcmH